MEDKYNQPMFLRKEVYMKNFLNLLLILVLGGCAATAEINRDYISAGPSRTGTVVVSVTDTGQYGQILAGNIRFRCGDIEGKLADHDVISRYLDGERLATPISLKLEVTRERPIGIVHVVELPIGQCEFFSYVASGGNGQVIVSVGTKRPFSIVFNVTESQVNYIGNFNTHFDNDRASYSFNDTQDRDLVALKRINPNIISKSVVKSVARVNNW